ncbi:MAG: glycosyltransferase family 4 protein [Actinomycetota bacterium]|nr:glycosyltransferase family 4 protein [Actinomycetota bacterium]
MAHSPIAFLPAVHRGQLPSDELIRQAEAGERPRWEHLELARRLDAVLIDAEYLAERGTPVARLVARHVGLFPAQVVEAFLRRKRFGTVCAWSDRLGLPLALLHKVSGWRGDLVLVSAWLSRPKKALFLSTLRVHTHLRAIISGSRSQLDIAGERLGVPRHKLQLAPWPVDTAFWRPQPGGTPGDVIASVGWEARDYPTLLEALDGVDVRLEVAVGVTLFATDAKTGGRGSEEFDLLSAVEPVLRRTYGYRLQEGLLPKLQAAQATGRVRVRQQLPPRELRELYARARFVVVPLHDVDSDCGITTIVESMAMEKAVIVTRTKGQVGVLEDGVQGMYVPPNDPDALRAAIVHLLAHPEEAERMGRAGRRLVEQRFSLDSYVDRLAPVIAGGHDGDAVDGEGPTRAGADAGRRAPGGAEPAA